MIGVWCAGACRATPGLAGGPRNGRWWPVFLMPGGAVLLLPGGAVLLLPGGAVLLLPGSPVPSVPGGTVLAPRIVRVPAQNV